jgi:hypothetical protein
MATREACGAPCWRPVAGVQKGSDIEKKHVEGVLTLYFMFGERPGPREEGGRRDGSGGVQVAFVWLSTEGLGEIFQVRIWKIRKNSKKLEKFQRMFVSVCKGLLPPATGSEYEKIWKIEKKNWEGSQEPR